MTTIELPWSVLPDYRCFGCSPHNPGGLGLTFDPHPDGVCARFQLDRRFESYPGVVHGGLVGVICDETMGNLIVLRRGRSAFTVSMRQRYVAPMLIGRPYTCVARLRAGADGGLFHTTAEVLDAHGAVCATATATYQPFTLADARARLALADDELAALSAALDTTALDTTAPNGA
jgi:acyl-coenzyme A thioesterase PaaI-like protein